MSRPAPSPASENLIPIAVVLVIAMGLVLAGVFAAVLLVRLPSVPTGSSPRVIGVDLGRSSDGTNWILTFTSVPTGITPSSTMLTIVNVSGGTPLPPTPLDSLNYSSQGALYVPVQPRGPVEAGDRLLLSTAIYPPGDEWRLSDGTAVLASGGLQ